MINQYKLFFSALCTFVLVGFLVMGEDDYQAHVETNNHACDMHMIWLSDTFARVPVDNRRGWPISALEFKQKCERDL